MTTPLERAFEASWSAMMKGDSLQMCLDRYPGLSEELRPLLVAALQAHELWDAIPTTSHGSRSRARVLSRAAALRQTSAKGMRLPRALALGMAVLLVVVFSGAGLAGASAQSLPGENLYPIKLAIEHVRLDLSLDPTTQASLAAAFEQRRVDEVKQLLLMGRVVRVQFDGRLDALSGDLYTISGVPVQVTADTQRAQDLRPGDYVTVSGVTHSGGWVLAASLRLAGQQFVGTVDTIGDGAWTVSGREIHLSPETKIEPGIGLGDSVAVQLHSQAGVTLAVSIHLVQRATPTPSLMPPEPTATPKTTPTEAAPSQEIEDEHATETPEVEAPESVTFSGSVTSKSSGEWIIDGRLVAITAQTELDGGITVGDKVEVRAIPMPDGSYRAERIRKLESSDDGGGSEEGGQSVEFTGRVESIGSHQWMIDGRAVQIDSHTEIEGSPRVGDKVQVKAFTKSNGGLLASKIEKQDSGSDGEGSSTPSNDD